MLSYRVLTFVLVEYRRRRIYQMATTLFRTAMTSDGMSRLVDNDIEF